MQGFVQENRGGCLIKFRAALKEAVDLFFLNAQRFVGFFLKFIVIVVGNETGAVGEKVMGNYVELLVLEISLGFAPGSEKKVVYQMRHGKQRGTFIETKPIQGKFGHFAAKGTVSLKNRDVEF